MNNRASSRQLSPLIQNQHLRVSAIQGKMSSLTKLLENMHEAAFYFWIVAATFPTLANKTFNYDAFAQSLTQYVPNVYPGYASLAFALCTILRLFVAKPLMYSPLALVIMILAIFTALAGLIQADQALLFAYLAITCLSVVGIALLLNDSVRFRRTSEITIVLVLTYYVVALLYLGAPQNRWVGGIHPNIFSAATLLSSLFALTARKWLGLASILFGIAIAVLVEARYAFVSGISFLIIFSAIHTATSRTKTVMFLIGTALLLLVVGPYLLERVLLVNDTARGLVGGISGRDVLNANFWPLFYQHPIVGFGFRYPFRIITPHSGVLNLILQVGPLAAAAILLIYLQALSRGLHRFMKARVALGPIHSMQIGSFALIPLFVFQPQILNLGDGAGIASLMCLAGAILQSQSHWKNRSDLHVRVRPFRRTNL